MRVRFSRELLTWQCPVIFPPFLNVQELDVTGREGLEREGRDLSFLASLIHVGLCFVSHQRILLVMLMMLKSHHSNGYPSFACRALQRMHLQIFSIQVPDKLIQANSDAFRYRHIVCVCVELFHVWVSSACSECVLGLYRKHVVSASHLWITYVDPHVGHTLLSICRSLK